MNSVFNWTTQGWGWLYLLTAFALVAACVILMLTKFGDMKLGLPEDKPEFSNISWFAMLFGSAIAAGIVFWGPAEPAYHCLSPPPFYGGEARTAEAAMNAMTYSYFHWGLSAWAIYVMLTIPVYRDRIPLDVSPSCPPIWDVQGSPAIPMGTRT